MLSNLFAPPDAMQMCIASITEFVLWALIMWCPHTNFHSNISHEDQRGKARAINQYTQPKKILCILIPHQRYSPLSSRTNLRGHRSPFYEEKQITGCSNISFSCIATLFIQTVKLTLIHPITTLPHDWIATHIIGLIPNAESCSFFNAWNLSAHQIKTRPYRHLSKLTNMEAWWALVQALKTHTKAITPAATANSSMQATIQSLMCRKWPEQQHFLHCAMQQLHSYKNLRVNKTNCFCFI